MVDYYALLKRALIEYYDNEYLRIGEMNQFMPDHAFTAEHNRRIRQIIEKSEKKYVTVMSRRVRRVAVIAAAIAIIIASAVVSIAIIKPQIFFEIKEKTTHWIIDFRQEDNDDDNGFTVFYPTVPEGYSITNENLVEDVIHDITYENSEGSVIYYSQMIADGTRSYLDSETGSIVEENINDHTVLLKSEKEKTTIVFEDGEYIYYIDGNCQKEVLLSIVREVLE